MNYSQELLTAAHKHCGHNRDALKTSDLCGCFYCCQVYPASDVKEYVRSKKDQPVPQDAVCPKCGIDSVLAGKSGLPMTEEFLKAMYNRWFED